MRSDADKNRDSATRVAAAFKEVDWLIPAYMSMGFIGRLASLIESSPRDQKPEILRQALTNAYSAEYLAAMVTERYPNTMHVREFVQQIDEAIRAFFSGYKYVAIVALVPVIEGIVRRIALRQNRDVGSGTKGLNDEFDALVERERISPNCYGERLVMLESLRDFIRDRFLKKTSDYGGLDEFNRHGILHGIFEKYGYETNFYREITLIDLLCFSTALMEGGSGFSPEETPKSRQLASRYLDLRSRAVAT